MYSERLFAKKCSVELPEQEYDEGIGISVWLNKLSRCKFKRGAANPFWVSWKAVEACGMVWCCIIFCGMVNGNGLCWTLAWRGITLVVWYSRVWYSLVTWCVEACEQVRTMPASRNPLEGNLHRAASPVCRCCRALLCCTCSCPYCSLSRRHSLGWSNLALLLLFNLFYQSVFLQDWCRHTTKTSRINFSSLSIEV